VTRDSTGRGILPGRGPSDGRRDADDDHEGAATVADLGGGVHRITHPLPWVLHHVHTYAVADPNGWTLVDTGLGDADAVPRWEAALAALGTPRIARIVITHHHPDHLGAGAALAALTGAEVVQGRRDAAIADEAWRRPAELAEFAAYLGEHGMPPAAVERVMAERERLPVFPAEPDRLVDEDDLIELGGEPFRVLLLPGHADGHIALLGERSGRMFGGDVLLEKITPNIGRWARSAPDPLGTYLATLRRIAELAPAVVYPGHRKTIVDAAGRAAEISAHHAARLAATRSAVAGGAGTAYDVARVLWGDALAPHELRFALAEALAHLEHLARAGAVMRQDSGLWTVVP
jgi:glyoxylase-like metal-dependent hydrolase (beta-lactamase superfamily II)